MIQAARSRWLGPVLVLAAGVAIAGCATGVPEPIRSAPESAPSLAQVRDAPDEHEQARVRWGGEIVEVRNEADGTWLEVVERPLRRPGEPRDADASEGRFLARVDGFLEPATYAPGRRITVAGGIDGEVSGTIGDYRYDYPVVAVEAHHLWPQQLDPAPRARRHYHDPWRCDPWYGHPGYGPRGCCHPYGPWW